MKNTSLRDDGSYLKDLMSALIMKLGIDHPRLIRLIKKQEEVISHNESKKTINGRVTNTMAALNKPSISWKKFMVFLRALKLPKVKVTVTLYLRSGDTISHDIDIVFDNKPKEH